MSFSARLTISAFTLCSITAISQAQVKAILYDKGKEVGTAAMDARLKSGGGLFISMNMKAKSGNLQISETFDASAMPLVETTIGEQAGTQFKIVINYGATGAKMSVTAGAKHNSKEFPYPKGANLRDRSNFWFIAQKPKVGAVDAYTEFDFETSAWTARTAKYLGDEKIKYHGQLVNAHKILGTTDTMWVDDRNLPYRSLNNKNGQLLVRQ
jgi:hypothetical protein